MSKQCEMMRKIQRYDFALYDLMLYLDTHPNCQKALQLYDQYRKKRKNAVEAYVKEFGSIVALQSSTDKKWNWGEGPYPWEREAN